MKKAAPYARVSSEIQRDEHTVDSQISELKRQIMEAGHVLVKEYVDDGYSGTRLDRPALEALRRDLKTDIFDVVYFLHTDRIARSVSHQDVVIADFLRYKKQIVVNGDDYLHNPENYFKLQILGAVAQLERAKYVERTTRGRNHRARMGQLVSQGHETFGYDYVKKSFTAPPKLLIKEREAKIVRKIFEMYVGGLSVYRIIRWLEEHKILTRKGKAMWRPCQMWRLLQNETYAGIRYFNRMTYDNPENTRAKGKKTKYVLRDRKEWIGVKVPEIVSRELFDGAQERMKLNHDRYKQPMMRQLLSNLTKCGECGAACIPVRRTVRKMLRIGILRIHHLAEYICTRRFSGPAHAPGIVRPCRNPWVSTHILEGKVFAMVKEYLLDPAVLKKHMDFFKKDYRSSQQRIEWKLMRIDKKEKGIAAQKKRLVDTYAAGHLAQQEYVDRNVALDQELLKIRNGKNELLLTVPLLDKKEVVEMSIREFCNNAKMRLEKCNDFSSKRQFLTDHIEKIIYEKTRVTIVGGVPLHSSDRGEVVGNPKIEFRIESDFNKKEFFKKRVRYVVDSRLKEWGSGGRDAAVYAARMKELQLPEVKTSSVTQQTINMPLRTATVRYLTKSYLQNQKEWNAARETLMKSIIKQSSKKFKSAQSNIPSGK
jgi:site-specific DNA recombinase